MKQGFHLYKLCIFPFKNFFFFMFGKNSHDLILLNFNCVPGKIRARDKSTTVIG